MSWHYGEIYRHLHPPGNQIGGNDLWIAAAARAHQQAIITRNVAEFERAPELQVVAY